MRRNGDWDLNGCHRVINSLIFRKHYISSRHANMHEIRMSIRLTCCHSHAKVPESFDPNRKYQRSDLKMELLLQPRA